ncbi:MAG: 50S ribosomal protein L18 [Patescibacteria group bacterium]
MIRKEQQKKRRVNRVRAKISGTAERPRLAVFRSLKHISAQLIDDANHKTLVAANESELGKTDKRKKAEIAVMLGKLIADKAKKAGIVKVVFDRRDKKYHGRIQAFADGAREGGLEF